jgi:uncharacterized repeat protein (TIGR01451 family)
MLAVTRNDIDTSSYPAAGDVQLTITNQSPDAAQHATVTLVLPSGFSLNAQTPSQGSCEVLSELLRCDLGSLPGSGNATLTLNLSSGTVGTHSLAFNASSPHFDSNVADNHETLSVTVPAPNSADLSLALNSQAIGTTYPLMADLEFQITNLSPDPASNITFGTTLPSGFTVRSLVASQGSCQVNGDQVQCAIGTIGATPQTVMIGLTGATPGNYVLSFTVSSPYPDPDASNNTLQINLVVPQAPQSSGGGGGMGLYLLCLLPFVLRRSPASND